MITSSADLFLNLGCASTGMPRPLSVTVTKPSAAEFDLDPGGVAGDRLVHGVVHDLGEEVVEALLVGAADIHARPAADRLQPLQHLDVGGGIGCPRRRPPSSGARPSHAAPRWRRISACRPPCRAWRTGPRTAWSCASRWKCLRTNHRSVWHGRRPFRSAIGARKNQSPQGLPLPNARQNAPNPCRTVRWGDTPCATRPVAIRFDDIRARDGLSSTPAPGA